MARKGDKLLEVLNSTFISKLEALVNATKTGSGNNYDPDTHLTITVKNHAATAKAKYTPVALGSPVLTYTGAINHRHERIIFNTKALSTSEPDNWVVLLEPLPGEIGATAEALMVGRTWVKTPTAVTDPSFLQVDGTGFVYASEGKGQALYSYSDGSTYTTLALIGAKAASSSTAVFLVGSGGIAASNTDTLPATLSGASASRLKMTGAVLDTTGNSETVYNVDNVAIPQYSIVFAIRVNSKWIAQYVIKQLRIDPSGYDYQLKSTTNSSAPWVIWASGAECPTSSGSGS